MSDSLYRAEITAEGFVQGVGFRYFVYRNAERLALKGYVKNLYSGEVFAVVEGKKEPIEEFFRIVKSGPSHAYVKKCTIAWTSYNGEFSSFEIRH